MTITEGLLQLNATDYIIIAVVLVSTLISLTRGFFKELISLVIWILGFWVAIKFHDTCATMLAPYIANLSIRIIVSFSGLLLTVLIFGSIFNYLLSFIITKSGFGGFDQLLGMIFGCTRGVLLVAVILLMISTTSFVQDEWWKKSILVPHFQVIVDWLRVFLPQKITSLVAVIK
jgi:membrane protein required for colicin V production